MQMIREISDMFGISIRMAVDMVIKDCHDRAKSGDLEFTLKPKGAKS